MEHTSDVLLDVRDLSVSFFTAQGEVKAVNGVSYYVNTGEVIAVVGESGCGKSVTQMAVMQLIQTPPGRILGGKVLLEGQNLLEYGPDSAEMRAVRGAKISMIFQEPMTSLNPVFTVGYQLSDIIRKHMGVSMREARRISCDALYKVGISDPQARMKNYPFEMSGGMRQRVLIALSVACKLQLIIADEPTTALDVTTQAMVMDLLMGIKEERNTSLVVVTHNLGLVSRYADRIYVMYAGRIIETGTTEQLLTAPKHPYTIGLMQSVPLLDHEKGKDLAPIDGAPPSLANLPDTCAFLPRCNHACDICRQSGQPELRQLGKRQVACHLDVEGLNL